MTDKMAREIVRELKETNSLLRRMSETGRSKKMDVDEAANMLTAAVQEALRGLASSAED